MFVCVRMFVLTLECVFVYVCGRACLCACVGLCMFVFPLACVCVCVRVSVGARRGRGGGRQTADAGERRSCTDRYMTVNVPCLPVPL